MKKLTLLLLAATLSTVSAYAQATAGEILGTVKDATGAAVASATVKVRNLDTNAVREVATSGEGTFRAFQIPPGNYEVTVEKAGFGKYVQGPIVLRLGQDADLDIRLSVAGVTETISVTSDAPLINTTNAEVGVNFDVKRITELPLAPNRNVLNLALSVAGVSQLSAGNNSFASGGVSFSVNGMRTRSNNFMIDGQDSNNPSVGGLVQEINNPDTVAEFRLVTNQFLPEYGRAAGSVVNIITKSGTNAYHGSAYWSYNGNPLNSRSNLDKRVFTKAPWRVENQFAGTVGGKIIKDRTFFFASGLRWTDRQFQSGTNITGAPTSEGKTILQNAAGTLPQVKALLDFLPAAQTPTGQSVRFTYLGQNYVVPVGTLSGAASVTGDYWQWLGKVDHRISDKHNLMVRFMSDDRTEVSGQAVPFGLTSRTPAKRYAGAVSLNSTLSPVMFNELRLNYQRLDSSTSAADQRAITIPSIEVPQLGLNGFNASGSRTAIGLAVNLPQSQVLNNYQIQNNFGWMKGNHSMKFGIDFRRQDQNQDFNPTIRGRLVYNTLDDLVADVGQTASVNTFLPGVGAWQAYRYYDYFFYVQDEWRISPRFTLTYGVRYETPGNPTDFLKSVNDKVVAQNNNDPRYRFTPVPPRDTNNWAPRVGFNYRIDDKTTFRAGYSRTYDLVFNNIFLNIYSAFPFTRVNNLAARSPNSYTTIYNWGIGGQQPPPISDPLAVTRTIVSGDFRAPLAEQVSAQVQRTLAQDWALTLGYVGTKGTALFSSVDGNPTVPGTNGTVRVNRAEGVRRLRANVGSSTYHSMQVSVEKRLSRNFSMASHYTWSSFIDDQSEVFNSSAAEVAVAQDSYNRRAERARSTYDRPHRFVVNGVYELPFLRSQQGVLGRIAGGWQLSGFLTLQSGAPFTPLSGNDPGFRVSGIDSLIGNPIRPNLNTTMDLSSMKLPDIIAAGGRALFTQVTAARPLGNAGRNILRADGINQLDFAVLKSFKLWEGHTLQYRCEFYNSTNTRNYGIPTATVSNTGFGLEGNTNGGNRRIVMMLRYMF